MYGRKHSEESKLKMASYGMLGKEHSEETKRKIGKSNSIALLGKKLSSDHKNSISEGLNGHVVSEETKSSPVLLDKVGAT